MRFLAALTVVLLGTGPAAVGAVEDEAAARDRQAEIARELDDARDALDEAVAVESSLLAEYDQITTQLAQARADQATVAGQVAAATAEMADAQAELDTAEREMRITRRRLTITEAKLEKARDTLQRRAIDTYMGRSNPIAMAHAVLDSDDVHEANARSTYLTAVAHSHIEVVEEHRRLREAAAELDRKASSIRQAALGLRDEVAARRDALAALEAQKAEAVAAVSALAADHERLVEEATASRAEHERRIAGLRQESDSVAALLRELQRQQPVSVSGGELSHPLPGARLTSTYGTRIHPIFGTSRTHHGVDWGAPAGRPIRAAGAGVVVAAGPRGGYGNTVVIDHGGALATLYAHQSSLAVSSGDQVGAGETIGYVGSTGYSTGPHLHFEVRVAGNPVDPLPYLS